MTASEQQYPPSGPTASRGTPRAVVCILGMHRSGTSLVSRLLNILGVSLGPPEHMMPWISGNPKGHWEHEGILEIDKEILARLGGSWREVPVFPQGWEHSPAFADLRQRARDMLAEDFGSARVWGWKDPRTCLTLPFWQLLVGSMKYVLCIRNPIDVARSLTARASEIDVDALRAQDLWLTYVNASLRHSSGSERLIVFYEDLMTDWRREWQRMGTFLGASFDSETTAEAQAFVEGELWHHRASMADVVDDDELSLSVKAVYLALRLAVSPHSRDGNDMLDLVGTLTEYALESHDLLTAVAAAGRHGAEAAEREAAEAWQLLRDHRATLVRLIGSSTPVGPDHLKLSGYRSVLEELREQATCVFPRGAKVLVVSKGDDELLDLPGVEATHFPQGEHGEYAGYHPATGADALAHLRDLRVAGADFIVFPKPYVWWLEQYTEVSDYLGTSAHLQASGDFGLIYELTEAFDGGVDV